jgi:hypothetical protein
MQGLKYPSTTFAADLIRGKSDKRMKSIFLLNLDKKIAFRRQLKTQGFGLTPRFF